jgi:O-antigen ligase
VATLFSIAFTSDQAGATAILFFDRVIIPMCLYLIVRLLEPDERDLKWMIPAILLVFLVQSLIGLLSWSAPGLVPSDWRGKIGARTTGTLRTPDVFGTTVLFCGLFLLHAGISHARRLSMRIGSVLLFALTMLMIFLTYSRANWLAGFVAVLGALYIYRRSLRLLVPIVVPIVAIALVSGLLDSQIQFARERMRSAESQESALSRLPVVVASVRMFEKKPVAGWGYEGFDSVSRRFQSRVGNLVSPVKPHASHNVYLTLLAEQGFVGLLLFLGPMFYWLFKTKARWRHIPATGLLSRRLIGLLWLAIASHIVVNNFSRMQVPFGLGMWWLILGLIASIVARYSKAEGQPWALA